MVELLNLTRTKIPTLPLDFLAEAILGTSCDVSIVVCGETRIRSLNKKNRGIDKATDVLSFPLEKGVGEIFICPSKVEKKMPTYAFNETKQQAYAFILIHALLHLAGHDHGSTMESEESAHMRVFMRLHDQTSNSSRNRHRNDIHKSSRRTGRRDR